jgi:hypothetical protein
MAGATVTGSFAASDRTANLLGAISLALTDRMVAEVATGFDRSETAAAALSALAQFLDGPSVDSTGGQSTGPSSRSGGCTAIRRPTSTRRPDQSHTDHPRDRTRRQPMDVPTLRFVRMWSPSRALPGRRRSPHSIPRVMPK